jgi:hypothetical protein
MKQVVKYMLIIIEELLNNCNQTILTIIECIYNFIVYNVILIIFDLTIGVLIYVYL